MIDYATSTLYRVGDITLCDACGYAIRLNHHTWNDDETGEPFGGLFWDHFTLNTFTCHVATPKLSVWEASFDWEHDR